MYNKIPCVCSIKTIVQKLRMYAKNSTTCLKADCNAQDTIRRRTVGPRRTNRHQTHQISAQLRMYSELHDMCSRALHVPFCKTRGLCKNAHIHTNYSWQMHYLLATYILVYTYQSAGANGLVAAVINIRSAHVLKCAIRSKQLHAHWQSAITLKRLVL